MDPDVKPVFKIIAGVFLLQGPKAQQTSLKPFMDQVQ